MPTCSVVMPVRNGERFVGEAIESLLTQAVRPSEIIVVDDGSADRTPEILRSYGTAIQIIALSGSGASAARNAGIRTASGELIAFLDSDDICLPERLEKQIRVLESDPDAAMVFCAMAYVDENGRLSGGEIRCPEYRREGFQGQLFERNRIGSTSAAMVRRQVLKALGGFDEALAYNEEYDLWLRIASQHPVAHVDEVLLHYRLHNENISRFREEQRLNEIRAMTKHSEDSIREALGKTYPDPYAADLAFARVLFRMERLDKAGDVLNRLRSDGHETPLLHFILGNVYMKQKALPQAEEAYRRCLGLDPDYAAAYNNLGVIFAAHNRHDDALRAFETARRLKQHYSDPCHNLLCLGKGDCQEMRPTFAPLRAVLKPVIPSTFDLRQAQGPVVELRDRSLSSGTGR